MQRFKFVEKLVDFRSSETGELSKVKKLFFETTNLVDGCVSVSDRIATREDVKAYPEAHAAFMASADVVEESPVIEVKKSKSKKGGLFS